jgi:hypothetical protein
MAQTNLPSEYYGHVPDPSKVPTPDPRDVETIESIIHASYETISGPAGQPRDWTRMRSLFLPEARSIRTSVIAPGKIAYNMMQSEDYIRQMNDWLVENGFIETEIHRHVDQFGNIAQVFSTYESRRSVDDPKPFMRGINSFQLFHDGSRWWIVNIMWRHESADLPIPAQYLP